MNEFNDNSKCKIEVNGAEVKITFADSFTAKRFAEYAADVTAKPDEEFRELCLHLFELQNKLRKNLSVNHKFAIQTAQKYWDEILAVYEEIIDHAGSVSQ